MRHVLCARVDGSNGISIEAMGLGPALEGGGRSLLVVSDDNFREQQRTVLLLFRVKGG